MKYLVYLNNWVYGYSFELGAYPNNGRDKMAMGMVPVYPVILLLFVFIFVYLIKYSLFVFKKLMYLFIFYRIISSTRWVYEISEKSLIYDKIFYFNNWIYLI